MPGAWISVIIIVLVLVIAAGFVGWRKGRAAGAYPPRGEFVRVDGFNFHYVAKGSGPCVVLLHGTGGSLEDYPPSVFEDLAREFRVVAIDRPGHGHSERPPAADTPLTQARIIRRVCQTLGCERAIVVGHSWSGAAALAYALENSADTRGVLLLQGTIYRQPSTVTPIVRLLASSWLGPILARTLIPLAGARAIRQTLERAFHPDSVPAEYLKRAQVMWTRPGQARAIALDTIGRDRSIDELCGRYPNLKVPILLVVGMADQFILPAGQSLRFQREFPSTRAIIISDVGHQIPMLRAQAVVDAVRELVTLADASHV